MTELEKILKEVKLKKYKSCADCYRYELGGYNENGYCHLGFPLEKIDPPVYRRNQTLNDTLCFNHKPKFGCIQKMYAYAPKFDIEKAREIAIKLEMAS